MIFYCNSISCQKLFSCYFLISNRRKPVWHLCVCVYIYIHTHDPGVSTNKLNSVLLRVYVTVTCTVRKYETSQHFVTI